MLQTIVWLLPISFTACSKDSWWCIAAYGITQSGGQTGTIYLLLISCAIFAFSQDSFKARALLFFKSLAVLSILVAVMAYLNEHFTKESLKIARPSHSYITSHVFPSIRVDSVYALDNQGRKHLLLQLVEANPDSFAAIDPRVLDHWIEESGYSFPSGHSFNAFLLGTILAFGMYHSSDERIRRLYMLPFLWAIAVATSRVALGAHSAMDVSFGAGLGMLVSHLFLRLSQVRTILGSKNLPG